MFSQSFGGKGYFNIDFTDVVVRGACVLHKGELMWPPPPPPTPAAVKKDAPKVIVEKPVDHQAVVLNRALLMAGGAGSVYGIGIMSPDPAFAAMFTTFSLACISGYYTVWGVVPALHSPLMSVTNAISGMTAAGGMLLCGGGILPNSAPTALAAAAVGLSFINITGEQLQIEVVRSLQKS